MEDVDILCLPSHIAEGRDSLPWKNGKGVVVDPIELGHRLRIAREARGLSQQAASDAIDVPRTAITQMESGNRAVSTLELSGLADAYCRPIAYFFEETARPEEEDVLVALHRAAPGLERDPAVRDEVDRCLALCRDGVALEAALGRPPRSGPPAYQMPAPRAAGEAMAQGEEVAREERRRLGVNDVPIPDMAGLICAQGIWASGLALPDHMSGLFMRHASIGLAVLVNASHPRGRKRFSYAHEYAHALMDRDRSMSVSSAANSTELVEKRANAFAASFLMPGNGVHEVLRRLDKGLPSRQERTALDVAGGGQVAAESRPVPGSQRLTYKDVAIVARHFGASYQASLYRLKNLRHVSRQESIELFKRGDLGKRYLEALDELEGVEGHRQYRERELRSEIMHLAIEAYRREEISRGRLLELSKSLGIRGATLLELAEAARER